MTDYSFGPLLAYDPTTRTLLPGASGLVYAVTDTAFATPLALRDLSGTTMANLVADGTGVLDEFIVADNSEVNWKSGTYVIHLSSFKGAFTLAQSAYNLAVAAQALATTASDAAEEAASLMPLGGVAGQALLKATNADLDLTWGTVATGGGGGGGGSNILILDEDDPVPAGTLAGTVIGRLADTIIIPTVMAAPSGGDNITHLQISVTSDTPTSGVFDAPVPANRQVGDLIVAVCATQSTVASANPWTFPAGWVSRYESPTGRKMAVATYAITDSAALTALGTVARILPPSDVGSGRAGYTLFRVTGADLAAPWAGKGGLQSGSNSVLAGAGFTATAPVGLTILAVCAQFSAGATLASAATPGMSTLDHHDFVHPTLGSATSLHMDQLQGPNDTSVGNYTMTLTPTSSAVLIGFEFGLKAAA